MTTSRLLLLSSIQTTMKAIRDPRMRGSWVIIGLFSLLANAGSATWLLTRLADWRTADPGVIEVRLWILLITSWLLVVTLTVIATLQRGLSSDEAELLLTQPLGPASRFRSLYLVILIMEAGPRALLFLLVPILVLGWEAPLWLLAGVLGTGAAVLAGLVGTLFVFRSVIASQSQVFWRLVVAGTVIAGLLAVVVRSGWIGLLAQRPPGLVLVTLLLALVLVALGPMAALFGRLYVTTYQYTQGRGGTYQTRTLPGIRQLARLSTHFRTPTGALFFKGLLNQSRIKLNLLRLIVVIGSLPLFLWIHSRLVPHHLPEILLFTGYGAGLALYTFADTAPSPIGGEGNRLALYLVSPLDLVALLRAKLAVFLLPVIVEGVVFTAILGWLLGLPWEILLFALAAIVLIDIGVAGLMVWGSAWDENLNLAAEGGFQMALQEQIPSTPRRIWLINLTILWLVLALFMIWRLPALLALPALLLLDVGVLVLAWRFARRYLQGLIEAG